MKFADPIQTHRAASLLLALGALGLTGLTAGCASNSPRDYIEEAPLSEVGSREASYAVATTPADLKRLIAEDLELRNAAGVYTGLEAFVGENATRGTATRANLIWQSVRPTTMLQYGQGRSVMTGVRQLGDLLANEGAKEMETAFESLRQGDFERVQRLRDEPMGIFHSSTAALSPEVRPYAMLADGVLSYRDVAANPDATSADVQVALDKLAAAQSELAKVGETKGMFLADAAAAQALERAGQIDAAAEYWMRIADSDEFLAQPQVMRQLVAARIKTYGVRMKERLIVEVEAERRAELRARDAMHSTQVADLQAKHRSFDAWAKEGFESSARRIQELSTMDESQTAQLASLAETAEARDSELGRATDALALRLGTVIDRTGTLESQTGLLIQRADALDEETESLGEAQEAIGERVDQEVANMRTNLDEAVAALRTDQAGLVSRADTLERRAAELTRSTAANAADLDGVKETAAVLRKEAAALRSQAASLAQETGSLRGSVEQNAATSQSLAASLARQDSELAQSLKDLANYQAAVDELTGSVSFDAMKAALDGSSTNDEAPADDGPAGSFMSVPAYLAVHSVPDVFGVDGKMDQLSAYYIPQ